MMASLVSQKTREKSSSQDLGMVTGALPALAAAWDVIAGGPARLLHPVRIKPLNINGLLQNFCKKDTKKRKLHKV